MAANFAPIRAGDAQRVLGVAAVATAEWVVVSADAGQGQEVARVAAVVVKEEAGFQVVTERLLLRLGRCMTTAVCTLRGDSEEIMGQVRWLRGA